MKKPHITFVSEPFKEPALLGRASSPFGEAGFVVRGEVLTNIFFPNEFSKDLARFEQLPSLSSREAQEWAEKIFSSSEKISAAAIGTPFQHQVWRQLLEIPWGKKVSYREVAEKVGGARFSRAVGSAVGKNPLAWLIPCHRVIYQNGVIGHYHWGQEIKFAMLGFEQNHPSA